MKWRTDKPTADVIVAEIGFGKSVAYYDVLARLGSGAYMGKNGVQPFSHILRWADLEEDETATDCNELLEDEINKYINTTWSGGEKVCKKHIEVIARHFAKWGAEHLKNKQK